MLQDDSARLLEPHTGKSIMSIPPQLASQSVISCAWSVHSQFLYMLLSNSIVHVWRPKAQTDQAQLQAVWNHHRRSRLVTLSMAAQETIPKAQLRLWGVSSTMHADEFLLAGTADGDVWIMDRRASAS